MSQEELFQKPKHQRQQKPDYTKDEIRQQKIKRIEHQFKTTFPKWLYDFALTVTEPIKVYAWFLQSKRYNVEWNDQSRVMNFIEYGHKINYARFGMSGVKRVLGRELFDHFGKVDFAINGVLQK